jgi:AsmA protein
MNQTWSLRGLRRLAVAAVVMLTVAYLALPLVASTRLVRDSIALELSEWSGYRVAIATAPEIGVWPGFRATLSNVTLSDRPDGGPVITVEELELDLSPLAALRGGVEFSAARFVRPVLYLASTDSGVSLPPLPLGSRIARSVLSARAALAFSPNSPNFTDLPADAFGSVTIVDGAIATGTPTDHIDLATDISGTIDLPALNLPGRIVGAAKLNDEPVSLDIHAGQPLLLLAGGVSQVTASVESKLLTASFDGTFQIDEKIEGKTKFATPSIRDSLAWIDAGLGQGIADTPISLSADLSGAPRQLNLDHLELRIGASEAVGALDLAVARAVPSLSGTLAFQTLDLDDALAVFNPHEAMDSAAEAGWLRWSNVDLRISAAQATTGSVALNDVAASANIHDGRSAFDISDGTALGGSVQAALRIDESKASMELTARGSDIDGALLGQALGLPRLIPAARGSLTVVLKGRPARLSALADTADGSINASFGAGHFEEFDLDSFLGLVRKGGFFSVDNVAKQALDIASVNFEATVKAGIANIDIADIELAERRLVLSGLAPLRGVGLALTGAILPRAPADATPEARFFVGGSWGAPFISSAIPGRPPE